MGNQKVNSHIFRQFLYKWLGYQIIKTRLNFFYAMTPDTQLQILQFEKTTQAISEYPVSRFTSDSQIISGISVLPLAPFPK